jgi:hypothetical protein
MESAQTDFAGACSFARTNTKKLGDELKSLIEYAKGHPEINGVDKGEMIANATLAYRHCEDVAMRLGKAIQAFEGGKSIYDSNDAKRVAQNPVPAGTYGQEQSDTVN